MAMTKTNLTIILATAIPGGVVIIVAVILLWRWSRRRNNARWLRRGITPIADEEIESWKTEKHGVQSHDEYDDENEPVLQQRNSPRSPPRHLRQNSSITSLQKPPSVIVYQTNYTGSVSSPPLHQGRPSMEFPSSKKNSVDLPQTPVLARARNSRPGLTDETVQGDDAYIPQLKRQPSRLAKSQPGSISGASTSNNNNNASSGSKRQHSRHRSTRSSVSTNGSNRDRWYGQQQQQAPEGLTRQSADLPRQRGHDRVYSSSANPPRLSLDEALSPGGLSPRPLLHKSEIGRAIG